MKRHKFNTGDRVKLVIESPHMVVIGHATGGQVICCWFDKLKEQRRTYAEAALEAAHVEALRPLIIAVSPAELPQPKSALSMPKSDAQLTAPQEVAVLPNAAAVARRKKRGYCG
jgi:uncharacterized protein YodC (DUF2158 family)